MLQVLQGYPLKSMGFHSSAAVHVLTEAMRHAYHDRNTYLGDPAFIDNPHRAPPVRALCGIVSVQINPNRATPSSALQGLAAADEHATTTHYSGG